jgi:subtilisin family serine protease
VQATSRKLLLVALGGTLALTACMPDQLDVTDPLQPRAEEASRAARTVIPGQYIVVLRPETADVDGLANSLVSAEDGTLLNTYRHTIKGFAARLPERAVERLRANPNVLMVEQDEVVELMGTTQTPATWGIDRVDQRNAPRDNSYTYFATGAGVDAYIIDTGIRYTHNEFGGRASFGVDYINDGRNGADCNGHGTHVAGTVGGSTYGVAKNVSLISVRVFACSGGSAWETIIAAIDWVTARHVAKPSPKRPSVVNMSLGGGRFQPVNDAVTASVAQGVHHAIAAGNDGQNACNYSPASTPEAVTVGGTNIGEGRQYNFGPCVDLFAPGVSITSAWWQNDTQINTISGTSMATPHVAGAMAMLLQIQPDLTPAQVESHLTRTASVNKISNVGTGSPNLLLYTPIEMDVQPGAISLSNTPTVNVVLISRPSFDATAVNANNVRLWIGNTPVAPATRGGNAIASARDFDGDGRTDHIISFRTADLVAAGLNTTRRDIGLRWTTADGQSEARDLTLPTRVP